MACSRSLRLIRGLRRSLHHLQIKHKSFARKGHHCECGDARTANQYVVSGHHCITSSSLICRKKVSQEKYFTVNVSPPELLSNRQSRAIYPLSPIHANTVSLVISLSMVGVSPRFHVSFYPHFATINVRDVNLVRPRYC